MTLVLRIRERRRTTSRAFSQGKAVPLAGRSRDRSLRQVSRVGAPSSRVLLTSSTSHKQLPGESKTDESSSDQRALATMHDRPRDHHRPRQSLHVASGEPRRCSHDKLVSRIACMVLSVWCLVYFCRYVPSACNGEHSDEPVGTRSASSCNTFACTAIEHWDMWLRRECEVPDEQ